LLVLINEQNASIDWLAGWGDRKLDGDFYIRQAFITHLSESLSTKALFICPGRRPNNYVRKLTFLVRLPLSRICQLTSLLGIIWQLQNILSKLSVTPNV